jgi:hypothetical protein
MDSYTPELIKLFRLAGCYHLRNGNGDHALWYSPINQRPFVVDNKIKSRHTFPDRPPFTLQQAMSPNYWPD